jgi:hypothetical protein
MKTALILTAALSAAPSAPVRVASVAPGEVVECAAPEGCIILTKRAMVQFINDLEREASKSCPGKKGGSV